ncbi:MAG: hypothetical protein ACFFDT_19655 [Candidatus Hodarchaeota archaeon]
MTDIRWKRALDDIEANKDQWLSYNPLFQAYIPQFDETFDRGIPMNLTYYVTRHLEDGRTFEEEMCRILFSTHSNATGKIYVLDGTVGSGKSCLVRYIIQDLLPNIHPGLLAIYIDTWNIFRDKGKERETLETAFLDAVERAVTSESSNLFARQREYFSAALNTLGYENLTEVQIFEMGRKLSVSDAIRFLLDLQKVTHLFIVIDNIDENSHDAIEQGKGFALTLANLVRQNRTKVATILIPLREYCANRFYDTERFAHKVLPTISEADVMRKRFEQLRDVINSSAKEFSHEVSYARYLDAKSGPKVQSMKITVTKNGACDFLQSLIDDVFSIKEPEVLNLLRKLGAGNLKILIGNSYNLFHSVKLPLIPLFERVFIPSEAIEAKDYHNLLPLEVTIECLLAIHYPFYDTNASHLLNLFNATSSTVPNDFQNVLVIPRIVYTLLNSGGISYDLLNEKLRDWGYPEPLVKKALAKCLHYGLVNSNHGNQIEHFGPDTVLSATSAADCYLNTLIYEPSYLQYICEDTPMPDKYLIPITDKYLSQASTGSKVLRLEGVKKFINFIEKVEMLERNHVLRQHKIDEQTFLREASIRQNEKGIWLGQALKERVIPEIQRIFR